MIENNEIDDRDLLFVVTNMTKEQAIKINRNDFIMHQIHAHIKSTITTIAKLRLQIKNLQEITKVYQMMYKDVWKKEQYLTIYEYISNLKAQGKFTFENMFSFKKKDLFKEESDYFCILDAYEFDM